MTAKHIPPGNSPSRQADYWLALLHSPFADAEQEQDFQDWLAASSENRAAWENAQTFWRQMGNLSPAQIAALEQHLLSAITPPAMVARPRRPQRCWYPVMLPAIVCLLVAAALGFMRWPGILADYRTAPGEQRLLQLTDGSSVLLNTASALSVDYRKNARNLTLYDGEAYFEVAPDTNRPFTVNTASGSVRALGTAFEVKQLDGDMRVTVYRHAVHLAFRSGDVIDRLEEGQQAAFTGGHGSAPVNVDLKLANSWRAHRLVFKNAILSMVTSELQRYRPGKIVILGSDLARHRVTGVFDPRDTEAALTVIENTLHLKQYRLGNRLVFLMAAH